ncbi:MAG: NAD-binding protein [Vulcanimicrobiaceae bacterium]|jgi:Trk K+ transport system NAD-binding subunit
MRAVPLILVVGGDSLAVRVCEELCATQGHRAALVWSHDHALAARLQRFDCEYVPHAPNDYDALVVAGVGEAIAIVAISDDDRLNLQVALKARDLNPTIRVVLRQFNRTLGRKLEQNLPNCSVISLASHAASSFVGAALDPSCFYALQFPDTDGVQVGFAERTAAELGVVGQSLREAQARLRMRIIARSGRPVADSTAPLEPDDRLVMFGRLEALESSSSTHHVKRVERRHNHLRRMRVGLAKRLAQARRIDPVLGRLVVALMTFVTLAIVYFSFALQLDPVTAVYFVATTFTATGYGDITPLGHGGIAMLASNLLMIGGLVASGIFIAFLSSALTQAQFTALQGLRQIRTHGHVLVCGAGNVGQSIIDDLLKLGQKVVVVDTHPDPAIVEASRARRLELLTADATRDATLALCNLGSARAVVAVLESDTANLEVALGVHGRNVQIPVVMRVQDDAFAVSIAGQFDAIQTFSTTSLAAPVFAMLSRFPGTRGRIAFGDDTYNVGERLQGEVPQPPPADLCIPLGVWRRGAFLFIDAFAEMEPYDRLLFLVPISQFKPSSGSRESLEATRT